MKVKNSLIYTNEELSAFLCELDKEKESLILLFGSMPNTATNSIITALREYNPQNIIIGCSSSGEIYQDEIHDNSLSIASVTFENTQLKRAEVKIQSAADSYACGESIAKQLYSPELRSIFLISDGLNVNGTEIIRGIQKHVSDNVIITGGLAGDGDRFEKTWVVSEADCVSEKIITAVGFYGEQITVSSGSRGGWDIFGPERIITRSEGNVVYEIDRQPALELYKKYLGNRAAELPSAALLFPITIRDEDESGKSDGVVRTILAIDEEKQSMTFAGDVPEGSRAQLMKANYDRLIDGAHAAASLTEKIAHNGDQIVIAISCVGRRLVLGVRSEEETQCCLEKMPENTCMLGFYSYGEISPNEVGKSTLHNQTMTITRISEK